MFKTYEVMRQLHGLLLFLTEALTLQAPKSLEEQLRTKLEEIEGFTQLAPVLLCRLEVGLHKAQVNRLLLQVSEHIRLPA